MQRGEVVFPGEDAEGGGVELELGGEGEGLAEPDGGEDAAEVAVGKNEDVAVNGADAGDQVLHAGDDLRGGFAAGAAVFKNIPAGILCENFGLGQTFVQAVVEFAEVFGNFGVGADSGESGGIAGTTARAGEDEREGKFFEARFEGRSLLAAVFRQRQIGERSMPAIERPFRFAVADEIQTHEKCFSA